MTENQTTPPTDPGDHPLRAMVDRLEATGAEPHTTLGAVIERFGDQSYLSAMMVPALIVASPLSGIPFLSSICGLTVALIAVQMVLPSRGHLWLPGWIERRPLSGPRVAKAARRLTGLADWLDGHARERFRLLVRRPGRTVLAALCALAGLAMPFLELVPFSSSILAVSILLMTTAMITRDGLFAVGGMAVMCMAPLVPLWVVTTVTD